MKNHPHIQQARAFARYDRLVIPFCWTLVIGGCAAVLLLLVECFGAGFLQQLTFDTARAEQIYLLSLVSAVGVAGIAGLALRHTPFRPLTKEQLAGLAKMAEENADVRAYLTLAMPRRPILRKAIFARALAIRRRNIDLQMDALAKEAKHREAMALSEAYQKLGNTLGAVSKEVYTPNSIDSGRLPQGKMEIEK